MNFSEIKNEILFLSIKPEYADKIFEGSKLVELRKSRPKVKVGDYVIIYVTKPIKALRGAFRVKGIIESKPQDLWNEHFDDLGINLQLFNQYYEGRMLSIGIQIEEVIVFKNEISLETIRKHIPRFTPPQTFRYFEPELISSFI